MKQFEVYSIQPSSFTSRCQFESIQFIMPLFIPSNHNVGCWCIFTLESISLWWLFVDYRLAIQLAERAEREIYRRTGNLSTAYCVCHWAILYSSNFTIAIKMNLYEIMIRIDGNGRTGSVAVLKYRKNRTRYFIREINQIIIIIKLFQFYEHIWSTNHYRRLNHIKIAGSLHSFFPYKFFFLYCLWLLVTCLTRLCDFMQTHIWIFVINDVSVRRRRRHHLFSSFLLTK